MAETDRLFLDYSCDKLKQYVSRIEDCLGRLKAEQVWLRGADQSNSVGNLILHLNGNIGQWIGCGVGGGEDHRERDAEFAARGGVPANELLDRLRTTVEEAIAIIRGLTPEQLLETTTVQNYRVSKLEAIYHVVEHCSGHTGQIIFATKLATGEDLGHYRHLEGKGTGSNPTPVP